jgi:hypothetical protein
MNLFKSRSTKIKQYLVSVHVCNLSFIIRTSLLFGPHHGEMVSMLALSVVDRGFKPQLGRSGVHTCKPLKVKDLVVDKKNLVMTRDRLYQPFFLNKDNI